MRPLDGSPEHVERGQCQPSNVSVPHFPLTGAEPKCHGVSPCLRIDTKYAFRY